MRIPYVRFNFYQNATFCRRSQRRPSSAWALKRRLTSQLHWAVDEAGLPVRFVMTDGVTADGKTAWQLIQGMKAERLIADKAYDSQEILNAGTFMGMEVCILPRKSRKIQRERDKDLYKTRRLVENAFLKLKRLRGISTRYCKTVASFFAAICLACVVIWG